MFGSSSGTNTGDIRDAGSVSGWRRSPGKENGNPIQYSCLQNPMDRGAWRATVPHKELDMTEQLSTMLSRLSPLITTIRNVINPLQCSCLESPGDGRAWWAIVCGVAQSRTCLKWLGLAETSFSSSHVKQVDAEPGIKESSCVGV